MMREIFAQRTCAYFGDSTQLLYLRARYYAPNTGSFLTRDTWPGDFDSPLTLNRWAYVVANPINYTDPSGNILDPSEPTHRGTIIHAMIQAQYAALYSSGGAVIPEHPIPMGSARGLRLIKVNGEEYWGTDKATLTTGYADIIDLGEGGLYEIKPYSAKTLGQVTVSWYITSWNYVAQQSNSGQYLRPGTRYPRYPGTIVGTDPKNPSKWITATLDELGGIPTGVILYSTLNKSNPRTVPVFVFEWNPETGKVERRSGAKAAQWHPEPVIKPSTAICTFILLKILEGAVCGPCALVPVP